MSRRILLLGLTLLLAVTGTAGVLLYVHQADARALAGKQTVVVLVAAGKIAAGTSAADAQRTSLVRSEILPRETVPADTLYSAADLDALDAAVASGDIEPGELLRRPMFVAKTAQLGGLDVPAGKLLVSIAVSAPAEVAGYVHAGSDVSVFDTFTVANDRTRTPAGDDLSRNHEYNQATRLLLTKVQVIAVGAAPTEGKSTAATNADANSVLVTVAVTQAEAEKLVHGAQVGRLYLALVPDGVVPTASAGVDNRTVFGTQRAAQS